MTRIRKTTLLITSVTVGASTLVGAITSPAGAAEGGAVARYNLTDAWPSSDDSATFTSIAMAESGGRASAGNIEFEWKVEEGER
jgi:TRAP-type mannitol/chloroaromatic compound transport system substrate-binding protein